ncbi:hypothetical protein HA466_0272880 [Hirschfeldia incana]|nr:hypothetical protein HA466_0272880 [Hirschfeldia incana]
MASRKPSVRHPSHSHPLRGHKAQVEEEIICSGCELDLIGAAFKCTKSECDYFLHKSCFELPRESRHKSHPGHPLTLLYSPSYQSSTYTCNACGEYGSGFVYNCSVCQYNVHVGCVSMPDTVKREGHVHALKLLYRSPCQNGLIFQCDECYETVPDNLWSYYCKECDYGTHLHSCAVEEEPKRGGSSNTSRNNDERSSAASELAAILEAHREMEKVLHKKNREMEKIQIDQLRFDMRLDMLGRL